MNKKFTALAMCSVTVFFGCAFSSCTNEKEKDPEVTEPTSFTVVAPDGAPALSIAKLLNEDTADDEVTYNIVDSSTIQTYVTGANPSADVCILPVNLASKLLGTGEAYKMVGVSTHGNLFMISAKTQEEVTKNNITSLLGKTIGVVNLANVPGLIFKSILSDCGVEYTEVSSGEEKASDKVNLIAVDGASVVPAEEFDYYVVPEPAASTKVSKVAAFNFVGSLQSLYGDGNGYVQAVMVAKNSVITTYSDYLADFLSDVESNYNWVTTADASTVVEAVTSHLTEGMTPTFSAATLTTQVIKNCNVNFTYTRDSVDATKDIIAKFMAIKPASAATVSDEFFYTI